MSIMGKYYMYYGSEFIEPYEVGRKGARRLAGEIIMDNIGTCRFHRGWAEEMMPEIMGSIFGLKEEYLQNIDKISKTIRTKNRSVFWESGRNVDIIESFLNRKQNVEHINDSKLDQWVEKFKQDKDTAAREFWQNMYTGIRAS